MASQTLSLGLPGVGKCLEDLGGGEGWEQAGFGKESQQNNMPYSSLSKTAFVSRETDFCQQEDQL